MPEVHILVGTLLIVTNAIVGIWGLIAYRRDRPPAGIYMQLLALSQTMVIAQATLGLILLSDGYRPGDKLHFAYGLLPLLAIAYPYALRGEDGRKNAEAKLSAILGKNIKLRLEVDEDVAEPPAETAPTNLPATVEKPAESPKPKAADPEGDFKNDPLIKKALEIFAGEIQTASK